MARVVVLVCAWAHIIYRGDCNKKGAEKMDRNIRVVTATAEKYPQESYAAVAHAIQLKWVFCNMRQKKQDRHSNDWLKFYE